MVVHETSNVPQGASRPRARGQRRPPSAPVPAGATGSFPRVPGALEGLFELAARFADGNRLGERDRFLVALVLEELFTNLVRHGAGGPIEVELRLEGGELAILVRDRDGTRFDPRTDAPPLDPGLPLAARSAGGLGIHLVKGLVDRLEYSHEGGTGTIRLFKRLE